MFSLKEIDAYNLPGIGILPIDCRAFFIISIPGKSCKPEQFRFLWKIKDPAVIKAMLCLDAKVKWQHPLILLCMLRVKEACLRIGARTRTVVC
jgi:hypothetical protein